MDAMAPLSLIGGERESVRDPFARAARSLPFNIVLTQLQAAMGYDWLVKLFGRRGRKNAC